MRLRGFSKHPKFDLFIRKSASEEELRKKISSSRAFVSDLDGTLYPGIILVDLAEFFFSNNRQCSEKQVAFHKLLTSKSRRDFLELTADFSEVLKGLPCNGFYCPLPKLIQKSYPSAFFFLKQMRKKGKKLFLVSLTSNYIAERVSRKFGFRKYCAINYASRGGRFSGVSLGNFQSAAELKFASLKKIGVKPDFIMAGDSVDDIPLFRMARVRIGVNPSKELLRSNCLDLVIMDKKDPWSSILKWLDAT